MVRGSQAPVRRLVPRPGDHGAFRPSVVGSQGLRLGPPATGGSGKEILQATVSWNGNGEPDHPCPAPFQSACAGFDADQRATIRPPASATLASALASLTAWGRPHMVRQI